MLQRNRYEFTVNDSAPYGSGDGCVERLSKSQE